MSTIIETKNLKAYYVTNAYGVERTVQAVDDISIEIQEGEVYGIAGESGCGKSTLLKVLLGSYKPPLTVVDGSITYYLDGETIHAEDLTEETERELRWKKISYIPQGSMHVLNPVRRIQDTFHDFIAAHRDVNKKESYKMTAAYLSELGLPQKVMRSFPHELSGGQRQRINIARAISVNPTLLLADEPTGNLDSRSGSMVFQLLHRLCRELSLAVLMVTHNMELASNMSRSMTIVDGQLVSA